MTKPNKLLVVGVVLALISAGTAGFVLQRGGTSNETPASITAFLKQHYQPGTCYGMPPGDEEPQIMVNKTAEGWQYKVADGRCCDITTHEGVVMGSGAAKQVRETSKHDSQVPC